MIPLHDDPALDAGRLPSAPWADHGEAAQPDDPLRPGDELDDLDEVRKVGEQLRPHLAGRRIAVAQEWVTARAGSEKVFEALAALLPDADLYALSIDHDATIVTDGRPITTTALDRSALRSNLAASLPLMPAAWWHLRRGRSYDLTVTSSHAFARCFAGPAGGTHLSYVHCPARYLWFPDVDQRMPPALQAAVWPMRAALKRLDRATADRTDAFAANSTITQDRIAEVYDRWSNVIFPPVATRFYGGAPSGEPRTHLLAFSRFVRYKRVDDAIRVAAALDQPIVVAGSGPGEASLRRLAAELDVEVEFRINPTDDELRSLYSTATALLFPAIEDFGIVPVEAQAAGCGVVTCGLGGTNDTVIDGVTGAHAATPALVDLVDATRRLLHDPPTDDACRRQAARFSYRTFAEHTRDWILSTITTS